MSVVVIFSHKCTSFHYAIPRVCQRREITVNATKPLQAQGTFPVDYTKIITTAGHYLTTGSVVSQYGEKVSCSGAAVVVRQSLCSKDGNFTQSKHRNVQESGCNPSISDTER